MKVYQLNFLVDDYQSLLPKDDNIFKTNQLSLDGSSKLAQWETPLDAVISNKRALIPDVYCLVPGGMLIAGKSVDILKSRLGNAEFLPVFWRNGKGWLVNVLGLYDCLDSGLSEWCMTKAGKKMFLEKYVFIKEKIPSDLIFKIHEDPFVCLCCDREDGSENLKSIIESYGLKGVAFELLWSN